MNIARRLTLHFREIQKNPLSYCYAEPLDPENDLTNWKGWIEGPDDSPYSHQRFDLSINFPSDYPFKPPKIRFLTPIYHPNIGANGEICLDLLHSQWSPALSVHSLLISLCSLLTDPNPEHGLNKETLHLFRTDRSKYEQTAKQWTINSKL